MAQNRRAPNNAVSADEAIRRALEAEREADQAVRECREQADRLLEDARASARRIADRANERIGFIHRRCTHKTAAAVDEMLRDNALRQPKRAPSETPIDEAQIRRAVEALAAELTGGAAGDGDA